MHSHLMAAPDTPKIKVVCPLLAGKLTGSVQGIFRLWEVFDERVLRGSEMDRSAGAIVTSRSGYIVSRILLFIHFWVSVYTSEQPV